MSTITDYIGNSPLIKITDPNDRVQLYAKLEGNNPGGSVKDRAAFNMLAKGLESGQYRSGDHLIEATSGNTGIALALYAKQLNLSISLVMPDNATPERIKTMRAYGADVILTPAEKTIEYSREYANQLSQDRGYKLINQFDNELNWQAHYASTGPEIWKDTNGSVTHFVSAMGTTGTIMGTSRFLKEKDSSIQIIGAQPKSGDSIPGIRKWSEVMRPGILDYNRIDTIEEVSREEAILGARILAMKHGIMGGMSSGGAFHLASKLSQQLSSGVIVFIVCDRGDRYLSSELYN
ncbi:Cysteine synthase B [Parvicella tangerina]|uniref:Cysteine synthase B n=2 Tax=Parvicella tangerina TaxID=2829795 RepID=A0A916JMC9_9FLAO|nr:Cysteine synthase B [Parvicella tangerina]